MKLASSKCKWLGILSIFMLILSVNACKETQEVKLTPNKLLPQVTGLRLLDNMANELGVWQISSDKTLAEMKSCSSAQSRLTAYPNPFVHSQTIYINLPCESVINVWVVPAAYAGKKPVSPDFKNTQISGADTVTVKNLFKNEVKQGNINISWNGTDNQNKLVPSGFYRIYFKTEELMMWQDVLLVHNHSELPADLQ